MKASLITNIFLVGALLLPVSSFADDSDSDRSSANAFVKDSIITSKIKGLYAKDKTVSAMHIKVDTDRMGVVQLSGKARSQAEADKAVSIAKGIESVTSVQNNIDINAALEIMS